MTRKTLTTEEIKEAARGKSARSQLYRWLAERYEELAPVLNERGPDWEGMATKFAEAGITGGKGRTPNGRMVLKTWAQVRKAKTGTPQKAQPPARPQVTAPRLPPRTGRPRPPGDDDDICDI